MKIGIIGNGFVGRAHAAAFCDKCEILINDPQYEHTVSIDDMAEQCELIFVCVPTPMNEDLSFDSSICDFVFVSLKKRTKSKITKPIVILKSTCIPQKVDEYSRISNIDFAFSPEFLTQRNADSDFVNQDYMIVGTNKLYIKKEIEDIFKRKSKCKITKFHKMSPVSAALLKYTRNSFLALKVSFMNEMYDLYTSLEQDDWQNFINVFHEDSRCGNSHADVPGFDGFKGWGGKCFPKDINALINLADDMGVSMDIMKTAWEVNLRIRENKDWLDIPWAVTKGENNAKKS